MSSSYRISLENWLGELDVRANRVLDIGGSQLPVKGRTKSWEVDSYTIADLPDPHKDSPSPDVAIDMNIGTKLSGPTTLLDLSTFKETKEEYIKVGDEIWLSGFSIVFCLEVFDYIWNPLTAMQNIYNLLCDGGKAYVTFPFMYPQHQPIEDDALRYAPGGIQKLADAVGLKIASMTPRYTETDAIEHFIRAERLRAAKHINHNVLGWIVEFTK